MATGNVLEQLTQGTAYLGIIGPSNHTTNTDTSLAGWDMSTIVRVIADLSVGAVGTNSTMQVYFRASATANMASPTNVTGSTANASVNTTVNLGGRISTVECRSDQMPAGTRYLQAVVITTTAAANWGLTVRGQAACYSPASQYNVANTVDQQVVCLP